MNTIIEYFTADPLRLLYFLGGTGGIWYWIGQWRDRIRLNVRLIKEGSFIDKDEMEKKSYLKCEVENIGGLPTSLQPTVALVAYDPKGNYHRYEGKIVELERDLPTHKPKMFTVNFDTEDIYEFLLFRTYSFHLTRGFRKSLRVWSASRKIITFWRFIYELMCFKWFGKYNEPKT
jgi:hypothetical protein